MQRDGQERAQATGQAKRARWAVAAMFMANGFVMGAWAPQIPLLMPRHGVTEAVLGLLILALGIGAVGAMLFTGRFIARFGARRVLQTFALALVPVLPLVVFSPTLPAVTLSMAVFGAIAGSMDVAMNAHAVEIERRLGRAIMSSSHGFWSLGGFVGGGAGSLVIAGWGAEAQSLGAAAVVAVIVIGAGRYLLPTDRTLLQQVAGGSAPLDAPKARLLPRDLHVWLLGFLAFFAMVPEGAILDWAAIYLQKELGADLVVSGLGFAFFAGAMAVMRFLGDAVRNRFGAVMTLRVSGLVGAAGLMAAALAPVDWVALAGFFVAGIGLANIVPILFSAAGNHPGLPSATAISIVTMVGYGGILIAPFTIGFLAEHMGFRPTYAALSALLVVVALLARRAADADGVRAVIKADAAARA
ncbi:MAG: hypothetical protein B7Z10_04020 [Rhodobacterales bacterium 32-66-7]|nr:MAG: hypothetical protein B7Z10_04020 [Rhodobacterales bacterium 32-66-7]